MSQFPQLQKQLTSLYTGDSILEGYALLSIDNTVTSVKQECGMLVNDNNEVYQVQITITKIEDNFLEPLTQEVTHK